VIVPELADTVQTELAIVKSMYDAELQSEVVAET